MATVVKNTNIAELLKVSGGDFAVLEKMTEEFRDLVRAPLKKAAVAASSSSGSGAVAASVPGKL